MFIEDLEHDGTDGSGHRLGSMGYGIAQSPLRAGHTTLGIDVRPEQEARFRAEDGIDGGLADMARGLNAVIVVLNAAQTEEVLFGLSGAVRLLRQGAAVLSSATVAPDFAKTMAAQCASRRIHYLEAPISGGAVKAARSLALPARLCG